MKTINATYSAWRKPGMLTIILLLVALRQGKASEVDITITGVLTGGWDQLGVFFRGNEAKDLRGKPFTLDYTFDDSMGKPNVSGNCIQGLSGEGKPSPGKAVLTLGNASYTFGGGVKFSSSGIYRDCAGTLIAIFVTEKKGTFFNEAPAVDVRITPGNGIPSLPQSRDWRTPMATTAINNQSSCFFIGHMNMGGEVKGCFDIAKVVIGKQ
jgi:hypothetical protein